MSTPQTTSGRRLPTDGDFRSPLHDDRVVARIGVWLGVCLSVCFVTGLISHYQQHPVGWLPLGPSPAWGYRVTQGLHILTGTLDICRSAGVDADTQLVDRPGLRLGEAVAEEAQKWRADLIVVGTHGRRGIGRALLGSGAEQIIRMSTIPVLTVRGNDQDKQNT
jgi:nucleotide-binding universal stress UspA family protein